MSTIFDLPANITWNISSKHDVIRKAIWGTVFFYRFNLKKKHWDERNDIFSFGQECYIIWARVKMIPTVSSRKLRLWGSWMPWSSKKKDEELENILKNSCQTQLELANALGVTQQDVSYRLKQLGRIRKEWVPHKLTPENKSRHDTALSLLSRFKKELFTQNCYYDEKWILYQVYKLKSAVF